MTETRILIVEDEVLIALDLEDLLGALDFVVVGVAHDSTTALDMLINRKPDLILLDISIKGDKNGIDIARLIRERYRLPFIFITSHADKSTLDQVKKTLPYGYIVKPFNESDLLSTIELALFRYASEQGNNIPALQELNQQIADPLTEKEYACLQDLCEGLTNKQIAAKQFVSVNTIKTHLKNLFQKLDVTNRTSAIQKARR